VVLAGPLQQFDLRHQHRLEPPAFLHLGGAFGPIEMVMVARNVSFMFVWYAMLWNLMEAVDKRNIVLRGPLGAGIARAC
jgi:hypothetical protein